MIRLFNHAMRSLLQVLDAQKISDSSVQFNERLVPRASPACIKRRPRRPNDPISVRPKTGRYPNIEPDVIGESEKDRAVLLTPFTPHRTIGRMASKSKISPQQLDALREIISEIAILNFVHVWQIGRERLAGRSSRKSARPYYYVNGSVREEIRVGQLLRIAPNDTSDRTLVCQDRRHRFVRDAKSITLDFDCRSSFGA